MALSERASKWIVWCVIPVIAGIVCSVLSDQLVMRNSSLNALEARIQQARLRLRPAKVERPVVIIGVTEDTRRKLRVPEDLDHLPRNIHGDLLRALDEAGARTAILDIRFERQRPSEDQVLINALRGLKQMRVTMCTGYPDGGSHRDIDGVGVQGSFVKNTIYDEASMPRVALGAGQPLQRKEDDRVVGACPIQLDTDGSRRLHMAFRAAMQFRECEDDGFALDSKRSVLTAGPLEWHLQENLGLLVDWPKNLNDFPHYELADALGKLRVQSGRKEFAGKLVVIGDMTGVDTIPVDAFDVKIHGAEFVAALTNTALKPTGLRRIFVPESVYRILSGLLATGAFAFAFARKAGVAVFGVGALFLIAWTLPVVIDLLFNRIMATLAPILGVFLSATSGLVASQSPLFREDFRSPGVTEEATAMFIDLRGSTQLLNEFGLERYRTISDDLLRIATHAVTSRGGIVERTMGDGMLTIFRSKPGRHHALRAADAAVEILKATDVEEGKMVPGLGVSIGLETGIVTGSYVGQGTRRAWSSAGASVNLAARLQSASQDLGTSIVVGPVTRRLIEHEYSTKLLGTLEAKGFPEPQQVASLLDKDKTENIK